MTALTWTPTSLDIMVAAEQELGAFLVAVEETSGAENLTKASEMWLQMLGVRMCEAAEEIEDNLERFFRRTTLCAAAQLAKELS